MFGCLRGVLATISRDDRSTQVTDDGHPLYLFKLDTAAGDTKGQGSDNFGAKWWLVAPSGQPITGPGGSAPASSASSSKAGGWA